MFVSFSKRLKSMSGFRLGVGLRLTRRNCWYFLFVLVLVGCFYFCWYSVLACGWMLYGLFYGCYLMFKYIPLLYGDCFRSVRSYSVCPVSI